MQRRTFLRLAAGAGAGAVLPSLGRVAFGAGEAGPTTVPTFAPPPPPEMIRFPEKTDLILWTDRPPNLETPLKHFRQDITANDAFFVRWHLAAIPTSVDPATFRLTLGGHVDQPLSLSLNDLRKQFEPVSVTAVCQCSGNSRQFFAPRVPGGQWGNGAIGNAKWTGVRLKDLLAKAKLKAGAVDVSFDGLDRGVLPTTPDFVKALSVEKSNDPDVIVAYEMNGQPLPLLNGFPLRLIVPGWFATYWVKSLTDIQVHSVPFGGFWVAKAYRVPKNPEMQEAPKDLAKETVPISTMPIRSLIVQPEPGEQVKAGAAYDVSGVAFDKGTGIAKVEVSGDGGKTWAAATLGPDLGKYSFRRWTYRWTPAAVGKQVLMARATSVGGETQPATPRWNRSGYGRNVIESVEVTVGRTT